MFLNLIWAGTAVKTRKRTQKSAPMRLAKAGVHGRRAYSIAGCLRQIKPYIKRAPPPRI